MARNIVSVAHQYLGVPYVWGGDTASGLDCSGFLQNVYKQMGISLPRTTFDQFKTGKAVTLQGLKPGDAVFTVPGHSGPDHVGMYVGHGMIQESPHTGTVNSLIPLKSFLGDGFVGARRYIGGLQGGSVSGPMQMGRSGAVGNQANALQAMTLLHGVLANNANRPAAQPPAQDPFAVRASLYGS